MNKDVLKKLISSHCFSKTILLVLSLFFIVGCGGKYLVKTYPSASKVYVRDIKTQEKRLIGLSPVQIDEDSRLGDVFFLVLEKNNYNTKEVMVRVNEGESLSVTAQLDPLTTDQLKEQQAAADGKKDDQKPQGQPDKKDKKKAEVDELKEKLDEINLRVALLENTLSFYKEAMFSPRFQGGSPKFDRDRSDKMVGYMFQAQQAIVRKSYGEALGLLDKALQIDEYASHAWVLKGSVKYLQRDFQGAKVAWERSLKLDPHNKVAYRYLSSVYKRLNLESLPERPEMLRYPAAQVEIEKRNPDPNQKRRRR